MKMVKLMLNIPLFLVKLMKLRFHSCLMIINQTMLMVLAFNCCIQFALNDPTIMIIPGSINIGGIPQVPYCVMVRIHSHKQRKFHGPFLNLPKGGSRFPLVGRHPLLGAL